MKRLILLLLFTFPLFAQNPVPNCSQGTSASPLTFTGVNHGPSVSTTTGSCAGSITWWLTWTSAGFTGYTIALQGSQDNVTFANVDSSLIQFSGSNPTVWTSATITNSIVARVSLPYLRVNVSSVTGSGTIKAQLLGYNGTLAKLDGGGGGGGAVSSVTGTSPIVVSPTTGATVVSCPTCQTSIPIPLTVPAGGTGHTSLTSNAVLAGNGTGPMAVTGVTIDGSGNVVTAGSITTGNGSSTTGNVALKGGTSGNTVNVTVAAATAAGTVTIPGVTGTAQYVATPGTPGHCQEYASDGIGSVDAGAACGSGGSGSANASCTFSATATGCGTPTSINVAAFGATSPNQFLTQCWTGASTTQTTLAIATYVYTTSAGVIQTIAPTFSAAAAAGYCVVNGAGGGGGGGGGTIYALGSLTAPPTTGWTTENLCGGTFAGTTQGFWQITGAACNATQIASSYRTAPTPPFNIDITVALSDGIFASAVYVAPFLGIRDSAGKYAGMSIGSSFSSGSIAYANTEIWNSATSRASAPYTLGPGISQGLAHLYQNPMYWRMNVTSTTLTFYYSFDFGLTYIQFGNTITVSGNLADLSFVAFGFQNESTIGRGETLLSYLAH